MSDFVSWLWAIPYCGLFVIPLIWWIISESTKPWRPMMSEYFDAWCAGCDEIVFSRFMEFTDSGLYRCLNCRNPIKTTKDLSNKIGYYKGVMYYGVTDQQEVNSDATQTVPSNNGHWEWTGMGREWIKN